MLGGAWVPTFVFPRWLQNLTAVVPTRWAIDGLDATTWRGLGLASVVWPIAFLLLASLLCGGLRCRQVPLGRGLRQCGRQAAEITPGVITESVGSFAVGEGDLPTSVSLAAGRLACRRIRSIASLR